MNPSNKVSLPKDQLKKLYKTQNSIEIAKFFGCSKPTVLRHLRELGIVRGQGKNTKPGKETRYCDYCGDSFPFQLSNLNQSPGAGQYCSKICQGKACRDEDSPHWKGGTKQLPSYELRQWRKEVTERDQGICQICRDSKDKIHVHHIKPWKDHPEHQFNVHNGIVLCILCHNLVHRFLRVTE